MLKLHLRYLLSRFNVLTIGVIIVLYTGGLIINLFSIPREISSFLARELYFNNLISLLKLIVVLLVVFLFATVSMPSNDNYQLCVLNKRKERIKYYFTKIISLILVILIIFLILFMLFVLLGLLATSWYKIELNHVKFFIFLFLESLMYGLLVYNLVKVLKSIMVIIIPCLIIILEEAFINESFINYLSYLFPVIENNHEISLSYGVIHIIILCVCYLILGLIKSYTLDIK